jgi:hypothetical protein
VQALGPPAEAQAAEPSLVRPSRERARAAKEAALPLSWRGQALEGASPAHRLRREPESGPAQGLAELALAPLAQEQAMGAALARRSPAGASPARAHWRQAEQAGSG